MPRFFSRRWFSAALLLLVLGSLLALISTTLASETTPSQVAPGATTEAAQPSIVAQPSETATPSASPATPQKTPASTPPPGIGDEYLALGDSVGYGVGAPFPEQLGYAGIFYDNYLKRVQPNLFYYKNFAIPGETSASFISRPRNLSQLDRALDEIDAAEKAGRRISPITLSIGGNDMLDARGKSQEEKNAALERYDANLQNILSRLTERTGGNSDLIVTTYYNPYAYNTRGEDEETAWVRRFNETIKKRATEYKARVADFFTPIFGKEKALTWIGLGDIHPNTTGYALLAVTLWQASGYDTTPPAIEESYGAALIKQGPLIAGQRLAFKIKVQDNFPAPLGADAAPGAGSINEATATVDKADKAKLVATPVKYSGGPPGTIEYSYMLDTGGLASGKHTLTFEATDMAGNTGSLALEFEIA